jgi:tryptophan 7-halogenase
MASERQFNMALMQELFTNHELLHREAHRPAVEGPDEVKRVGILGGGTAGWFTALALRAQLPSLEVTVIESPSIPIIGVGEASVPSLVAFIHHYLDLDVLEFTRAVKPTWKQGIRFEWGLPGDYVFQAPFDWEANGIGMLGSMAETGNVSDFTLQGHLMARGTTPILRHGDTLQSFLPILALAYHLDNQRLVAYLRKTAVERGVRHLDRKIADAVIDAGEGDEDPRVRHLVAEGGEELAFDLYIDCSGFRSFLLEHKLGARFESYASTLFTDCAFAFNAPHGGKPQPYTTARTMPAGWCWNIPMVEDDHHGYVYSSAHTSHDEAEAEVRRTWPDISNGRVVRFRSGRHDRPWIGNVYAIGNAYAFVEPLESTGLLMIMRAITSLVRAFPIGPQAQPMRDFVNKTTARDWDRLRWFLAAHYKFNERLDTPFWQDVRATCDVSGLQAALDLFQAYGPLSLLPRAMRTSLVEEAGIFFYGLHGLDTILLGQHVPHPKLDREPTAAWKKRQAAAIEFATRALPYPEALRAVDAHPEWLVQFVGLPQGWVQKMATFL